jgi:hypothetical protein
MILIGKSFDLVAYALRRCIKFEMRSQMRSKSSFRDYLNQFVFQNGLASTNIDILVDLCVEQWMLFT